MGNAHVALSHFVSYFAPLLYAALLKKGEGGRQACSAYRDRPFVDTVTLEL